MMWFHAKKKGYFTESFNEAENIFKRHNFK